MKSISEAKIAWVLCTLLEEVTEQLWTRYDKEFLRFATEEQKKDIREAERLSKMDPDSPSEIEL